MARRYLVTGATGVSKAERILGWRPAHTLAEGLHATLEWTRESLAARA